MNRSRLPTLVVVFCIFSNSLSTIEAADLQMVDGAGVVTGVIDVSRQGLQVYEYSGNRFFYERAPRYDSPGGRYLGFYNLLLNRIIRFPRNGYGPIERADLDTPFPQFVPGSVFIEPIGSNPGFNPYLIDWLNPAPGIYPGGYVTPGYPYWGGSYGGIGYIGGYYVEGIHLSVGGIRPPLLPPSYAPAAPQTLLLESREVDKPNLPPVQIEFINSHNETIVISLTDNFHPNRRPEYQLAPGESQRVQLPRDAGKTRIEVFQTVDAVGVPIEQETRVDVPPTVRYQVIVHRIRIQSIAIDRTGTSPNPIEDINTQGIGVGRFTLPPGDQLTSGVIDAFGIAQAAGNRGTVAPILPFD